MAALWRVCAEPVRTGSVFGAESEMLRADEFADLRADKVKNLGEVLVPEHELHDFIFEVRDAQRDRKVMEGRNPFLFAVIARFIICVFGSHVKKSLAFGELLVYQFPPKKEEMLNTMTTFH
jgi:hypothetical protein